MTDTPPPEWAIEKARETYFDTNMHPTETRIEAIARALATDRAETEARVERETIERCAETLNDQISYCRLRAEEKHKTGNKKSEGMFILMANTLSYQVTAIRSLPTKYKEPTNG